MATLEKLAEQCEKAAGPDRELDFYIWAALNGVTEITNPAEGHPMTPGRGGRVEGRDANGEWHLYGFVDPGEANRNWSPYGGEDRYPNYTRSLDAAMTLVPEGWPRSVSDNAGILGLHGHASVTANPGGNIRKFTADAATPALALSAAALKARSQLHGGDDG